MSTVALYQQGSQNSAMTTQLSVSVLNYTCLITDLPVSAVYTFKTARGLSLDDAFPCAWLAVPGAVREWHLVRKEKNQSVYLRRSGQKIKP